MTAGLLVSRLNKTRLHKTAVTDPTVFNINKYVVYRNLYNKLIRLIKNFIFKLNYKAVQRTLR